MTEPISPKNSGLSLLELVLAMALFALVAVLGLQTLTVSLRLKDGINTAQDASAKLARPIAMLRNDLSSIIPARFQPPGQISTQSALWASPDGRRLEMSLGGQQNLSRTGQVQPNALHRVIWRHDPETAALTRQSWPVLAPATDTMISPEIVMMEGVTGLDLRSYWPGMGWQPGVTTLATGPGALDEDNAIANQIGAEPLPKAIAITLRLQQGGEIPLLEVLQ